MNSVLEDRRFTSPTEDTTERTLAIMSSELHEGSLPVLLKELGRLLSEPPASPYVLICVQNPCPSVRICATGWEWDLSEVMNKTLKEVAVLEEWDKAKRGAVVTVTPSILEDVAEHTAVDQLRASRDTSLLDLSSMVAAVMKVKKEKDNSRTKAGAVPDWFPLFEPAVSRRSTPVQDRLKRFCKRNNSSVARRPLREFVCPCCDDVMKEPVTLDTQTNCCKACAHSLFAQEGGGICPVTGLNLSSRTTPNDGLKRRINVWEVTLAAFGSQTSDTSQPVNTHSSNTTTGGVRRRAGESRVEGSATSVNIESGRAFERAAIERWFARSDGDSLQGNPKRLRVEEDSKTADVMTLRRLILDQGSVSNDLDTICAEVDRLLQAAEKLRLKDAGAVVKEVPNMLKCPITLDIMEDPVLALDGHTYERQAIENWFLQSGASPITNLPLPSKQLIPNFSVRSAVKEWQERAEKLLSREAVCI